MWSRPKHWIASIILYLAQIISSFQIDFLLKSTFRVLYIWPALGFSLIFIFWHRNWTLGHTDWISLVIRLFLVVSNDIIFLIPQDDMSRFTCLDTYTSEWYCLSQFKPAMRLLFSHMQMIVSLSILNIYSAKFLYSSLTISD